MAIIGNAYIVVHAVTTGFQKSVDDALKGAQNSFSNAAKSFNSSSAGIKRNPLQSWMSDLKRETDQAYDAFFKFITANYLADPAISVAIGAVSALVSGLVALVSQVAAATPALMALAGAGVALGSAFLTAKLAFGGIGKALQQLGKSKTGGGGGGGNSQKQVANAEKALAKALENSRESLARADRNLTDAEKRLTDARKQASESLQQLNFDAEDAAISEKKAAIELERARETLQRVQDLPPNSRARREAELAYQEADLNMRRAKDRNSDLAKETEKRNKLGVEGSEEVVQATRDVQDAADARAKAEVDALRAITDAEEALAAARKSGSGGGGSSTQAFDKLTEGAKLFTLYINSLRPKLDELRSAAGEKLFGPLTGALQNLVDNLFPSLKGMVSSVGGALGKSALDFSQIVTGADNVKAFNSVSKTSEFVVSRLGKVLGNLYSVFINLLDAAGPLTRRFTAWVTTLTNGWKSTIETKNRTGALAKTFKSAGDIAAQLGRILKNIFTAFMDIGKAASGPGSGGESLLNAFEGATKKFVDFVKKLSENGKLQQFFRDVAENTKKLGSLAVEVVKWFLKLGDNPAIGKTADIIRTDVVPAFGRMFDILQGAAPAVATFFGKASKFIEHFAEQASIESFFGTLGKGVDILNKIFDNPTVERIAAGAAAFLGVVKALHLMQMGGSFAAKVFLSYPMKVFGWIQSTQKGLTTLAGAFPELASSLGIVGETGAVSFGAAATALAEFLVVGAAVAAIIYELWHNSETFRNAIKDLVSSGINALKDAFNGIKGAFEDVLDKFGGAGSVLDTVNGFFKRLGDFLGTYIIPIFKTYLVSAIKFFQHAIEGVIYVIGGIIKAFQSVYEFVRGVFSLLTGDMDGVKEHFGKAWQAIKDAVILIFNGIWNFILAGFDRIKMFLAPFIGAFKFAWDAIKKIIETVIKIVKTLIGYWISWIKLQIKVLVIVFKAVWDAIAAAIKFVWEKVIKPVWDAILAGFKFAWDGIKAAFSLVWDFIKLEISIGVEVIKTIFNGIKTAFETVWNGLKAVFETAWAIVTTAVQTGVDIVKGIFDTIKEAFTTVFDSLAGVAEAAFRTALGVIQGIVNGILSAIEIAVNAAIIAINAVIRAYNAIPLAPDISTIDHVHLPRLGEKPVVGGLYGRIMGQILGMVGGSTGGGVPKMAYGGTVSPRPGGTLALIGEAGRPERVEPLDPDGLSKRDKAMIAMMGGNGGVNVHVYPSAGMDERELASLVSRQLALQLRKGAA